MRFIGALAALSLALAACTTEVDSLRPVQIGGPIFGTGWSLTIPADALADSGESAEAVQSMVVGVLEGIDASMSTWRADSELSRLNETPGGVAVAISEGLDEVLTLSLAIHVASGGAFDPTVGPLVDLWGFGAKGDRSGSAPDAQAVERIREAVGLGLLEIRHGRPTTVTKAVDALEVDLSAIAKGWAVDRVADVLAEAGVDRYFLEVGGEVRVLGASPRGDAWRVGVNRPTEQADGGNEVAFAVSVESGAVATSGDYRNYRIVDGQRVAHIVDPRTGRPCANPPASVTVLAPECAVADAWATALTVLGAEEGIALIERTPGVEASFLIRNDDGAFTRLATGGFDAWVLEGPR